MPIVIAAVLVAGLALLSDVWGRARLVVLGQLALALSLAFTSWTTTAWGLAAGLACAGAASGVACGAAQALLVVARRGEADRAMVRWALFSAAGDLVAPFLTAGAIGLGASYRAAMLAIAVLVAVQCAASAIAPSRGKRRAIGDLAAEPALDNDGDSGDAEPLRSAIVRAARRPRLWAWLLAAGSCTLLDELVVALAALRMARDEHAGEVVATAAAVVFAVGSIAGTALTDRAVARFSSGRVLAASSVACLLAVAALAASRGVATSCAALLLVGRGLRAASPARAGARAYDEMPGTTRAPCTRPSDASSSWSTSSRRSASASWPTATACARRSDALILQPLVILACAAALRRPRPDVSQSSPRPSLAGRGPPTRPVVPWTTARQAIRCDAAWRRTGATTSTRSSRWRATTSRFEELSR